MFPGNSSGQGFYQGSATAVGGFAQTGFSSIDPFNYPMPGRRDLMSLSTIDPNRDAMKTTTRKFATKRFESSNLNTGDIFGASPKIHGSKEVNKPEFQNTNWDIARSSPAALHIGLNKPPANLNTRDIDGASPKCVQFTTNRQGHNPLSPVYQLPKVEIRPITPPKFIRDQMCINDIAGARPKHDWHNDAKTKETNKIDDIEGTKARARHMPRKNSAGYTSQDYSDVTRPHFISQRVANPMNPSYVIKGEDGKPMHIGEIEGNKPQVLPPRRERGDVNLTLKTQDILGATSGSKGLGVFAENHVRREVRNINKTDDVEGAQAGSLKRGTNSMRQTNPLDPAYQWLGNSELVDPCSAYSRPKNEPARGTKASGFDRTGSIAQITAKEALKKPLDTIPEKSVQESAKEPNDYTNNKLYQASRTHGEAEEAKPSKRSNPDYEVASQGSVFQRNAVQGLPNKEAAFHVAKTLPRVQVDAGLPQPGVSVLNEKRLREHEDMMSKDPNYKKNEKRFFGVPSHHTVQRSASSVQKFDHFISKA